MFRTKIIALAAAGALISAPVAAVANDFAAGVVTGVIGTIIVNEATKKPPRNRTVVVRPRPESPQRAANRVTQTALNYFGFNAGTPDGLFGPRTEGAVRAYQSYMGFPVVGKLTNPQRTILVNAYNRGEAGGAATLQLVSSSPDGARALLQAERDALMGVTAGGSSGGTPVNTPTGSDDGSTVMAGNDGSATPTPNPLPLIPVPAGNTDVATVCQGAGGPKITAVSMGDPNEALVQGFCAAVAEAKATSNGLANSVQGVTVAQIEAQCEQLGPVVAGYVASLGTKGREAVLSDVRAFVDDSGADPAQLASTAKICLGMGYKAADMNVAVGSGLLLTAMGEPAYGELMGHHLQNGIGVSANADRAMDWLTWSTEQVAAGATPVFGDAGRVQLMDEAVLRMNGGAPSSAAKSSGSKGKKPVLTGADN